MPDRKSLPSSVEQKHLDINRSPETMLPHMKQSRTYFSESQDTPHEDVSEPSEEDLAEEMYENIDKSVNQGRWLSSNLMKSRDES